MSEILKLKLSQLVSKLLIVAVALGLGMASCTYHTNDYDPLEVPEVVYFEADIIPIFEESCSIAGCHNGTIPPDLRTDIAYPSLILGQYVVPGTAAEDNKLYQVIDGGTMDAYASDLERAYIKKWIDDGALNN